MSIWEYERRQKMEKVVEEPVRQSWKRRIAVALAVGLICVAIWVPLIVQIAK